MLNFYLKVPLIEIRTSLMSKEDFRMIYTYIAWHFRVWKWEWTLHWGETRLEKENKKNLRSFNIN